MDTLPNITPAAKDVLAQLFIHGPTFDGDISSKAGRGELFDYGLAARIEGYSYLTETGMRLALFYRYDREKERRRSEISKALHEYREKNNGL